MKIKVQIDDYMPSTFELDGQEVRKLCSNSIERVVNSAIEVCDECPQLENHLDDVVRSDLIELKRLIVRLWYSAQQAVHAKEAEIY